MRWPRLGLAAAAGAAACIAWAADKRGLLVLPGVCGMIVVAALCAPRMEEGKQGLVSVLRKLRDRLPEALRERLRPPARLNKPVGWMIVHQRKLLMIPALCLGLLVFPLRTAWLGETTNVEWERQMDAESMRQVHDGTARRWSQQARSTRSWSDWSWMDSNLDRIVPPFTAVIRSNRSTHGLDQDLMNRCKELAEDDFLVIPDFFYTDCSRATLAHNTRENLSQITALPLGLVWIAVPLCLLPGRQRWWQGLLSGGALIAAVSSMWLVMASLNVMPTRYLIQFTTGAALLIPVGIGRLIHTFLPRSVAWGVSGFVCLGLSSWAQSVDINQRSSEHTWSYNQGFLERYYDLTQTIAATMDPTDDFLDCSDRGMNIWFLPNYTRFGTPMLKVDDAGRCKQWISWAPEGNTRWMTISPGLKLRPQHGNGPPASLEPSLRSDPNWRLEFDDRGAGVQLWKREQ